MAANSHSLRHFNLLLENYEMVYKQIIKNTQSMYSGATLIIKK